MDNIFIIQRHHRFAYQRHTDQGGRLCYPYVQWKQSRGGWCLPWWWDWWRSCPLPWWRRGWRRLTRTGWRRRRRRMCSFSIGEGCGPVGGVGAFMIPFIKYFQYFSSRERCAHNFNDTYRSTVGTMLAMFCTRFFLLESCSSPRWDNLPSVYQRYPLLGLNLGYMYWG